MTTALDGERQHVVAGVRHAGQHVGHIGDLNDGERVSIHCAAVHGACLVVPRIVCGDDGARTPARSSTANWTLLALLVVVIVEAFAGIVVAALAKHWGKLGVS